MKQAGAETSYRHLVSELPGACTCTLGVVRVLRVRRNDGAVRLICLACRTAEEVPRDQLAAVHAERVANCDRTGDPLGRTRPTVPGPRRGRS